MNEMSFLCDAIYRGSEVVDGAVSPSKLATMTENVLSRETSIKNSVHLNAERLSRGERCQLQIDEERLRVSTSRKDEGFESDSESASTTSGSVSDEALCTSPEIKVIDDHVLRLEKLIRKDSGIHLCTSKGFEDGGSAYGNSSSGAESEEDIPRREQKMEAKYTISNVNQKTMYKEHNLQMENGTRDNILLSDILFCHVMSHRPRIVIVVAKSVYSFITTAHLFECLSQEAAKTLYNCYYTASNKYKLNRYRISKRRNEGNGSNDKAVLDRIHVSIRNVRKKSSSEQSRKNENVFNYKPVKGPESSLNGKNKEKFRSFENISTDIEANVNVIEINNQTSLAQDSAGMTQRTDENGVTHIEIGSTPCSPTNVIQDPINNGTKVMFDCEQVLSALERLSIHSSNHPNSYLNHVGVTSSCPNSLIQTSREIHAARENEKERRLRQRQPPLLIKKEPFGKMDTLLRKEIRRRGERRNRSRSEERSRFEIIENDLSELTTVEMPHANFSKIQDNSMNMLNKEYQFREMVGNNDYRLIQTERQSISGRNKENEERRRPHSNHNKGPAPPPPPRRHPNDPSLILVATKSGQENSRSYYPKESHIVGGTKLVRIDYPLYPPWNMNSDINNNPKRVYYAHPSWMSSNEYHANRHNNSSSYSEIQKRSRSKSPARQPTVSRYIDAVSTFSLPQKLKDLSDTVIQSLKNTAPTLNTPFDNIDRLSQDRVSGRAERKRSLSNLKSKNDDLLRPVIKRGKKVDNSADGKRVTFSAYATVQVMD